MRQVVDSGRSEDGMIAIKDATCCQCNNPLGITFDGRRRKCAGCKDKTRRNRNERRNRRLREERHLMAATKSRLQDAEEKLLKEAIAEATVEFSGPSWHMGPRLKGKIDVKNKCVTGAHGELSTNKPVWLGTFAGDMGLTKARLVKDLLTKWGYKDIRDIASKDAPRFQP